MLLNEIMQFTMNDKQPSTASERYRMQGKKAKTTTEIRTVLAQLVQAVLAGHIRKGEYDTIKSYLEHRLSAMRSAGKVSNVAKDTIVPDQVQPFGPLQRY